MHNLFSLADLIYLMKRLRDPKDGCSWDIKQNFLSITPSTIEEAYEVVDAIERGDREDIKEELGDLLFQIIFYAELASEENAFNFDDVVSTLTQKLIRRHPHVFPNGDLYSHQIEDMSNIDVKAQWEAIKSAERIGKGQLAVLDDIPAALPAITRALKLQKRAASVNFDWSSISPIFEKLQEEIVELQQAILKNDEGNNIHNIESELGDILFTAVYLARHLKVEPEKALRVTNNKFTRRFNFMAVQAENLGLDLAVMSDKELDSLWAQAKQST